MTESQVWFVLGLLALCLSPIWGAILLMCLTVVVTATYSLLRLLVDLSKEAFEVMIDWFKAKFIALKWWINKRC